MYNTDTPQKLVSEILHHTNASTLYWPDWCFLQKAIDSGQDSAVQPTPGQTIEVKQGMYWI